jgi:hypothetical protein
LGAWGVPDRARKIASFVTGTMPNQKPAQAMGITNLIKETGFFTESLGDNEVFL